MKTQSILLAVLVAAVSASAQTFSAAVGRTNIVHTAYPTLGAISQNIKKTGSLIAPAKVDICAKISGRLAALELEDGTRVEEGTYVKKGQRIALIEDREYKASLAAAKAALQSAEATLVDSGREFDRAKALFADGSATEQERDRAQATYERSVAAVEQAKAQLESAQISLDETVITAPMDGIVSARAVDPGALLGNGARIVTLTEMDYLRFQVYMPTTSYAFLRKGDVPIQLEIDAYPGEIIDAKVTRVFPVADDATRSILVEARLENPEGKYLPGMFAVGTINLNFHDNAVIVPYDCLVRNVGETILYKNDNGTARAVKVKLGLRDDNRQEVLEGITAEDEIVVDGQHRLTDGLPIRVEKLN